MEERQSRLSSTVWRRFQQYFCVRLIPQNSMFSNFCHVLKFYSDIDNQVKDKVAKSLLSTNGCNSVAIKRLNSSQDWVGNIFCEFTDETDLNEDELHKVLHEAAVNIQYILPEFKENKIE